MASTTGPSPIRWPQRMPGSQYCARLMDSTPPATATSQSPSLIAWAADTIACSPLPHSRLTVKAGVSTGRPPLTAANRLYACSLYRLTHHGGREVAGRDGREAAAEFADRGPGGGQHQYVLFRFHDHFPHMSSPPLTAQICPVM